MLHSEAEVHKNNGDEINKRKQLIIAQLMTMIVLLHGSDQQHTEPTSRRTPIIISTPAGRLAEPDTPPGTGVGFTRVEIV
jgi:hypothetical protein